MEVLFTFLGNALPRFNWCDNIRFRFYRFAGMTIGRDSKFFGPIMIRPLGGAKNIQVGSDAFLNTEIRFGCPSQKITIGNRCQIGPRVCFESVNHTLIFSKECGRKDEVLPITVEDEVWIGCGAIILPRVTIGRGSVVAAGAVVTQSVASMCVVGGVPAKVIKMLDNNVSNKA